jgi:hypothetical protein
MDEDGIWAQVLYPNVAGFGAGRLLTLRDPEIMLACVQAYNDFLAEYASVDARRFVPIMALPMWDISLCQAEVARSADRGHKGVIMTGEPVQWGLPHLADPHWDPLWATLQEAELSVNFHIAAGDISKKYDVVYEHAGEHANYANIAVQFGIANARVINNLILGGLCHRFPRLKSVSGLPLWYGQAELFLTTHFFGMKINRYMHDHGITTTTLGKVAAKAFRNGAVTSHAWRRKPISEDEIVSSPVLNYPLTQYMYCGPNEGAAAAVLVRADRAQAYTDSPVYLRASGQANVITI